MSLHLYRLDKDDGATYWIAATDPEKALHHGREAYYIPAEDGCAVAVTMEPDDKPMTLRDEESTVEELFDAGWPPDATVDGRRITAPAGSWAAYIGDGVMLGGTGF